MPNFGQIREMNFSLVFPYQHSSPILDVSYTRHLISVHSSWVLVYLTWTRRREDSFLTKFWNNHQQHEFDNADELPSSIGSSLSWGSRHFCCACCWAFHAPVSSCPFSLRVWNGLEPSSQPDKVARKWFVPLGHNHLNHTKVWRRSHDYHGYGKLWGSSLSVHPFGWWRSLSHTTIQSTVSTWHEPSLASMIYLHLLGSTLR